MRRIGMAVLGLTVISAPVLGQRSALREVRDRGSFGVNVVVAQPLGAFRRTGSVAPGLSGFAVVGGSSMLGLRIDGSWMVYDSRYQGYGVSTTSQIGSLAIGPQLTIGQGPIRLYGFATAGGSLFWSNASYSGGCGCYDSDDFYLDGDFTTLTSAGTGVLIQVAQKRSSIAIDLGVRGVRHDRVSYVPTGGLTQNSNGTFSAQRVETPVELRVFQIGISIGIR
jgi:hypothetical protein